MRGPHDAADASADEDDKALLYVHGAVALDTQARATIRAALKQAGISVVHEKLLAVNNSSSADPACKSPRLVFLVSTVAGTEEGLEELLDPEAGPNSLFATFGDCFTISSNLSGIETIFPPEKEEQTASSDIALTSKTTSEHERRVFTFDNDKDESQEHSIDEEADNDVVAEQLIAISRTPLSRQRTPLGQPIPASTPSRQLVRDSDDGISLNDHDERSPSTARTGRPDSASKARILPSSLSAPTIQPRLSKAAALRMGIKLPDKRSTERREEVDNNGTAVAEEQREKVFVPGTVRRAVTPPKSLAKPSVAPRQNRASALRTTDGVELRGAAVRPPTSRRESVGTSERSSPFIGLPGFAKQKKSQNASPSRNEQHPTPGQNRAAMLRQSSAEGHLSPIPQPTQPRKALTTAERAAANRIVHRRSSLDVSSSPMSASTSQMGSVRSNVSSRPSLSRESSQDFFSQEAHGNQVGSPSRSPSIAPRANKAAELRLAARRAAKA